MYTIVRVGTSEDKRKNLFPHGAFILLGEIREYKEVNIEYQMVIRASKKKIQQGIGVRGTLDFHKVGWQGPHW